MRLNLTFAHVGMEIGMVRDFAALMEETEKSLRAEARKKIWKEYDRDEPDERDIGNYIENLLDDGVSLRFMSAGSLVAAWAVYEATVSSVAGYLRKEREVELRLSDLHGDFLRKARKYFNDVLRVDLHPVGTDWERLVAIVEIRHALAHGNGRLADVKEDRERKIRELASKTPGLTIKEGYLIVNSGFARGEIDFLARCLDDLIQRVAPVFGSTNGT